MQVQEGRRVNLRPLQKPNDAGLLKHREATTSVRYRDNANRLVKAAGNAGERRARAVRGVLLIRPLKKAMPGV